MSSRSQVVIAVKEGPLRASLQVNPEPLLDQADTVQDCPEGVIWEFESIKWYDDDPEIVELLERLHGHEEDYLLLVANEEYPSDDSQCHGEWEDNPWEIYKCVRATIEWH